MKSNYGKAIIAILAFVTLTGLLPSQSQALIFYDTRAEMPKNDFVDWGTFLPNRAISNHGIIAAANNLFNQFLMATPFNLFVDCAPDEKLLFTYGTTTITFNQPVASVGAEIQNLLLGSFTGTIEAFDIHHVSLGSFSLAGNNQMFLGVGDPSNSIASIEFSTSNILLDFGFAINRLDITISDNNNSDNNVAGGGVVPTPGSLLLFGSALLGLAGLRYGISN